MANFNGIALLTDSTAVCLQYDIVGRLFMEQAFEPDLLQKLHVFDLTARRESGRFQEKE